MSFRILAGHKRAPTSDTNNGFVSGLLGGLLWSERRRAGREAQALWHPGGSRAVGDDPVPGEAPSRTVARCVLNPTTLSREHTRPHQQGRARGRRQRVRCRAAGPVARRECGASRSAGGNAYRPRPYARRTVPHIAGWALNNAKEGGGCFRLRADTFSPGLHVGRPSCPRRTPHWVVPQRVIVSDQGERARIGENGLRRSTKTTSRLASRETGVGLAVRFRMRMDLDAAKAERAV